MPKNKAIKTKFQKYAVQKKTSLDKSVGKLDLVGHFLYNWRIKMILPHIRGRLLDIGCGINKLSKVYGDGIGIDVYQFGGADFIFENTTDIPFNNESFDTITIVGALNHIPKKKEVLREMHRVLKTDGQLIITMIPPMISKIWHFFRFPWDRDQKERGMKKGEVYGMTREETKNILVETGYKVMKEKSFMLYVNRLTIARKS